MALERAASLHLIDVLEEQIDGIEGELRRLSADHRYLQLLMSAPGISWVLGYTIAAEIGDIERFSTPAKLISYTSLCPRVRQSGEVDRRGALSKHGPAYLRWALIEAAHNAIRCYPPYRALAERQRARLGKQRGGSVAAITIARKLAEASWWMLTRNRPFAPAGARVPLTDAGGGVVGVHFEHLAGLEVSHRLGDEGGSDRRTPCRVRRGCDVVW